MSATDGQLAAILLALANTHEQTVDCPLGTFARDLKDQMARQGSTSVGDALSERSMTLVKEEENINAAREMMCRTQDKLRAELVRVEAQIHEQERHLVAVQQQKKLCKAALNMFIAGDVPVLTSAPPVSSPTAAKTTGEKARAAQSGSARQHSTARDGEDTESTQPGDVAPEPTMPAAVVSGGGANTRSPSAKADDTSPSSRTAAAGVTMSGTSLVNLLRMPDVKETTLLHAIDTYEDENILRNPSWMAAATYPDILTVFIALAKHVPEPRAPVQLAELRVLRHVLLATPTSTAAHNKNLCAMLDTLIQKGGAVPTLTKLLSSVNDDVKCDALEALSPLICGTHPMAAAGINPTLAITARREFLKENGLEPLVTIVACSTSESVLERALVLMWGILSREESGDTAYTDGHSIRYEVRRLGGLRAVLDLLYTDSLAILENVCMVIGYITREESSKKEVREVGGLEKITATLRHPSDSIKTKMAGAVWNCASNGENRAFLSRLGVIPALLELLPSSRGSDAAYEFVRENAAGALWNLSVDADNKTQILEYGGIPILVDTLSSSASTAVVENVSGTLWNCSAAVETRPLIRKAGGIPVLLSLLGGEQGGKARSAAPTSDKIIDNVSGSLRNCAINDQNKPAIKDAGGVELLVKLLRSNLLESPAHPLSAATLDKLASTLWILTIAPDIKQTVRLAGGIEVACQILRQSSPILAAHTGKSGSLFPEAPPLASNGGSGGPLPPGDAFKQLYAPSVLQKLPSAQPKFTVSMNIREKLVGVLRNCSTAPENRPDMIRADVVACLVAVVLDCYANCTVFPSPASHKSCSRACDPSIQLRETVASALWYLARDDKTTTAQQGGLELMCMFLVSPHQPSVVLEQAAGALSSMSVSNAENRDTIRAKGGLSALIQLVCEKAKVEFPARTGTDAGGKVDSGQSTFTVLNALLTIRNCTVSNAGNLKACAEATRAPTGHFADTLVYILDNGSEECAREAALTIKNISTDAKALDVLCRKSVVEKLNALAKRSINDTVRRAAASTLQSIARAQKPTG